MRKLFWTCMFSGVVLAGGVISTAHFAVHHPDSMVGRVLHGASHVASVVNPVIGLTPLAKHARAMEAAEEQSAQDDTDAWQADPVPVPDDPIPVAADEFDAKAPEPGPIVVSNSGTAPIVICEDEKAVNPVTPYKETTLLQAADVEAAGAICPAAAACLSAEYAPAPQVMPYCKDDEVYELLPMPTEELEVLPMPRLIEEEDEVGMILSKEPIHDACLLRCTGRPAEAIHHSAKPRLRLFGSQDDEYCPEHPEIDTMEFRPSDRHLYDYGPGSL
jgi:hypothetical protein